MLRTLQSDVFKILVYVAASLVLAAAMAPWIYNLGMGVAEITEGKDTNGFLSWIGDAARRSETNFPRFFDRSLLLSALLLLGPVVAWLRVGRDGRRFRDTPWSLRLPETVVSDAGQPLRSNPNGWPQWIVGFLLAGGLLLVSGWVMVKAGFFMWRDAAESVHGVPNPWLEDIRWGSAVRKALPSALIVSLIEEVLFRGILLGIFLRAMKPVAAIVSLSFLFAFVHFLEPPMGAKVPDPEALDAGFVFLGQILARFAEPFSMIGRFAMLVTLSVVLSVARWRTASLWLPIGLHAGWVFCYQVFKSATWPVSGLPKLAEWLVGGSLMEGLLPLAVVVMTGVLVAMMTRARTDDPLENA
ncbi:CPBP family intramembrane glutamic endopeptidase [Haloferula rosea]|uniref:CPBP family intramembrane metalloprotease n=1 Tax=Haloferula rosea TaxID=490093 RepID=A0A934VEN8_9BACT|nr:CPBP family intramembrane glutamic endopeptidase [Haloferula rosea]MBK1825725.1 CPBP family intramembrane metalloprotease [Haloferula rosea]